ncbi:MAG: hypothetical protein MHM6MM_004671 [Cercozoa sp. M6MM]
MNDDVPLETTIREQWRFKSWLDAFPLNQQTVLDYFRHSHFYLRSCNNEVLAMQGRVPSPATLSQMKGLEYGLVPSSDPDLFVIEKRWRISPDRTELLHVFFIVGGTNENARGRVFPLPDMRGVVRARCSSALFHLREAVTQLLSTEPSDDNNNDLAAARVANERMIDDGDSENAERDLEDADPEDAERKRITTSAVDQALAQLISSSLD